MQPFSYDVIDEMDPYIFGQYLARLVSIYLDAGCNFGVGPLPILNTTANNWRSWIPYKVSQWYHRRSAGLETANFKDGTSGETRTPKVLPPGDFESPASTSSATPAL